MYHSRLLDDGRDEPSGFLQLVVQGRMAGRHTRPSWSPEAYRGLYGYRQDLEYGARTVHSYQLVFLSSSSLMFYLNKSDTLNLLERQYVGPFPS